MRSRKAEPRRCAPPQGGVHAQPLPYMRSITRALFLAPHTDDVEFGCGATVHKLVQAGVQVRVVAFSSCSDKRLVDEFNASMDVLGVKDRWVLDFPVRLFYHLRQEVLDALIEYRAWQPDVVYCPNSDDIHQDHQVVSTEARRAFKDTTILGYELPWNSFQFRTTLFETVTEEQVAAKVRAMECYQSQAHRPYASEAFIRANAVMRGTSIKTTYAEAFEVIRMVLP